MSCDVEMPENKKRMHLWTPRRLSSIRRTMSIQATKRAGQERPVTAINCANPEQKIPVQEELHQEHISASSDVQNSGAWAGESNETASTGSAFREERSGLDDAGGWASNLFYVYARQTDDSRFSRFLIIFSDARVCTEWWSLIQIHFGGSPSNIREGPQYFSFKGVDLPGRAWKHQAFVYLRTRWMYSEIGDAVGTMGKGQEVIPLQDERGFLVTQVVTFKPSAVSFEGERTSSRTPSVAESSRLREERTSKPFRLTTKRDSGIHLPNSPLLNYNHERSFSLPLVSPASQPQIANPDPLSNSFDFTRMEANLTKIEKLLESNASQLRSLEHVQAANIERLTAAIVQNAEMIRELGLGQWKLGEACEELRKAIGEGFDVRLLDRLRTSEGSLKSVVTGSEGNICSCGHEVKKGPRKIGRTVIGYVYAEKPKI